MRMKTACNIVKNVLDKHKKENLNEKQFYHVTQK
jgi:hypothetical protein